MAVTHDFSLQMLLHRIPSGDAVSASTVPESKDKKSKPSVGEVPLLPAVVGEAARIALLLDVAGQSPGVFADHKVHGEGAMEWVGGVPVVLVYV